MNLGFPIRLIVLSFSLILAIAMITYGLFKGKKNAILISYLWVLILLSIWLSAQILRVFSFHQPVEWLFVRYEYIAICFISLSWLFFCLTYTENTFVKRNFRLSLFGLAVPPTLSLLAVLTNQSHHLFFGDGDVNFSKYSILFWIHTITSYSYCVIGTVLLVRYSVKQFGYVKKQAWSLIFAALVPVSLNIVLVSGALNPGFDITPVGLTFTLLFFVIAVFRYKFLNIIPIAYREIVVNMKEAILVIDNFGEIVHSNQAFVQNIQRFLPETSDIHQLVANLQNNVESSAATERVLKAIGSETVTSISGELNLAHPTLRSFQVNVQPITNGMEVIGRLVTFSDVTEYKQMLLKLNAQNTQLIEKNNQLKDYSATVAELAISKERNRLARDVHDTIGQTMTLLVTLLQVSSMNCYTNPQKTEEKLAQAMKVAQDGLTEIRRSIVGLAPEKVGNTSLAGIINQLIAEYRTTGLQIDFSMKGLELEYSQLIYDAIYRLCQEALTNSLRHGKAKKALIDLALFNDLIQFQVRDDGIGCDKLEKGFGLSAMEKRVEAMGGQIQFCANELTGFEIQVEIPVIHRKN